MLSITGVFLASCANDDINITITPSVESVEIIVGQDSNVFFTVKDFKFDGSVNINVFDQSVSGQETESGHISFTQSYNNSGVTSVNITGLSGGTSTLVATTKEGGNKTAQIVVKVKEYSNSLSLKDELFVLTEGKDFVPSVNDFVFSDNTNEKVLNFYYIDENYSIIGDRSKIESPDIQFVQFDDDGYYSFSQANEENLIAAKEFKSVKLDKTDANNIKMIFTQTSLSVEGGNQTFVVENVKDTQSFYFIAEYENQTTRNTYYIVAKFTAFLGFDEDEFKILSEDLQEKDSFSLITYATEELGKDRFVVETPFYLDNLANPNLVFDYDLSVEDSQKVSLNLLSTVQQDDKVRYTFEITPKVTYKTTANINFNLYYKGFKEAKNEEVSLTKTFVASILVAPKEINVNEQKTMNLCEFYNGNIGDYGWQKFDISVYPEDSSYDGVKIYFDSDVVEVKQGDQNIRSGMQITDLSKPVYIRGSYFAEPGTYEGDDAIKLVLQKHELLTNEISYKIPFVIKPCATKIEFLHEEYGYSESTPEYGIYVSSSVSQILFGGIYADQEFTNISIKYPVGDRKAQIEYYGAEEIIEGTETKHVIVLKVTPIKVGLQTVSVYLDNGRSISATFKVVDTFDSVKIDQDLINKDNTGTISVTKKEKDGDDDTGLDIVIRNGAGQDDKYAKQCSISIDSNNGTDVINSIIYPNLSQNNIVKVEQYENEKGEFKIITNTFGDEEINFVVKGVMVDENFMLTEISKTLTVNVTSYNPVSSLKVFQGQNSEALASNLILYAHGQNTKQQELDILVEGVDVYNVYNPKTKVYDPTRLNDENKTQYVYWTSTERVEQASSYVETMEYGKVYNIGGYVLFNTTNLTLTPIKAGGNFTLMASIRQYDLLMSFAINIRTFEYVEVESIDTNISTENIVFNPSNKTYSFVVNTYDPSIATNPEIDLIFEEISGCESPLDEDIEITQINNGSWLVVLKAKDNMQQNVTYRCRLVVAAKDWISTNTPKYLGYETKVKTHVVEYQNGTVENPYELTSSADILSIQANSHYKLTRTIDMSAYLDSEDFKNLNKMTFNGSIVGDNNAKITGLNITNGNDGYYGLFKELSSTAKIQNITFEGSFKNLQISENSAYIGIIAGKNLGTIENVSVLLNESNIAIPGTGNYYIGGVVGQNIGTVKKNAALNSAMTTALFGGVLDITNSSSGTIYVGGICGDNANLITDVAEKSNYGLNGYLAYTLINITNTSSGAVYAGGVCGNNGGNITDILVGGKIASISPNVYVGGVSAKISGGELDGITTRTFLRGQNVGAVTAKFTSGTISNIVVEGTDDGKSINKEASMIIKFGTSNDISDSMVVCGETGKTFTEVKLNTYVSRTHESTFNNSIDAYCGDYIILDGSTIVNRKYFTEQSTTDLSIATNAGFVEMVSTSDAQMFTAYYFEAESYLSGGNYTTSNLQDIQKLLDSKFNKIAVGSKLCPFVISGAGYFTITSENSLITIDKNGNLNIKGTGIGKLVVSNTLNARYNKVVYLNILNYFNNNAIGNYSIYVSDDVRLTNDTSNASIYSNANTIINVLPTLKSLESDYGFVVSEDGNISLNNTEIKLVANSNGFTSSVYPAEMTYASYEISSDMLVFSKKVGINIASGTTETIQLITSIKATIGGVEYTYTYTENPTITFSYFEGTTNVSTNFDNYILSTTGRVLDQVYLESDDIENEQLNYVILRNGVEVQSNTNDLFSVSGSKVSEVKYNIEISVNKSSDKYKNRFVEDIYGDYVVRYMGKTNQSTIYVDIPMTLTDEYLEGVVIENYASEQTFIRTDKIIPAQYGLISVTILPTDYEFTTLELINNAINYTSGSTNANFEVGYFNKNDSNKFTLIDGAVYKNNGVSISKKAIITTLEDNYDGQIYIRYLFANSAAVKDGNRVSLTARLKKGSEEVYSEELNYTIYKKFIFDVTLHNKPFEMEQTQRTYYVARGVSYVLDIENSGYDTNTISVVTPDSEFASISEENGVYTLNISERSIGGEQKTITVNASASRTDANGKTYTVVQTITCKIMEYVVNYLATNDNLCYDIVTGYEDGNLIVPLGTTNNLSIDLGKGKYLEYNANLSGVTEKINVFLAEATKVGSWTVYTDLKEDSQPLPDNFGRNSNQKANYQSNNITTTSQIENKYFTFNGLRYSLNSEHDPYTLKHYIFTYEAEFVPGDGEYSIRTVTSDSVSKNILYSEFSMLGYIRGSEEAPNPIKDYEGLKAMLNGAHYILTNDIYITPQDFEPINGTFASLDGNSYSIIFEAGEYDVTKYSEVGIFSQISGSSLVKNLKVVFNCTAAQRLSFVTTSNATTIVGIIAARNLGSITNAKVIGNGGVFEINYNSVSTPSAGCYVAGISAINSGFITNSQVKLSMTTTVSLSGIVGQNNGTIASSYYKNGILKNTSSENTKFYTAGIAIANSENGQILTSYSSGTVDNEHIYSYDTTVSRIDSTVQNAGFIYSNLGLVRDCYSNIPLNTSSSTSGFVYENAGRIINCFTTSVILNKNNQNNHYFAGATNITGTNGTFENCYYLKENNAKYIDAQGDEITGINQSLASETIKGVNELNIAGFADFDNFTTYSYGDSSLEFNNVWMFVAKSTMVLNDEFKETAIITSTETGKYISSSYENQVFAGGRFELVSANIIATSFREMDESKTSTEDGQTTYFYNYMVNEYGTILNPYIVSSAQNFENNMTSYGNANENSGYFRFVNDIDYADYEDDMTTQNVSLFGIIEGNGASVKNIDMTGSETLKNAGLVGTISGALNKLAGAMNLTIIPRIVNFPNANITGTLTGTLQNANIANISVLSGILSSTGEEASSVTVCGKNIVGGVVGLVIGSSNIKNITSKVGSKAMSIVDHETLVDGIYGSSNNITKYSYAGGIFGYVYAQSKGKAVNINLLTMSSRDAYAIGSKAGFVFGGISRNVSVSNVDLTISSEMTISAFKFGGFVAGESAADLTNIKVDGTGYQNTIFSTKSFRPMAVGGITGFMICGKLQNVQMGQSFEIENVGDETIEYVGGIAGYVNTLTFAGNSEFEEIVMSADISARNILGGIIGYAETQTTMQKVAIRRENETQTLKVDGRLNYSYVGGFIGITAQKAKITDAYSKANIEVNAYVYNSEITSYVGSIIAKYDGVGLGELENIYTTTQYKVTLEDKKAFGNIQKMNNRQTLINSNNGAFYTLNALNVNSASASVYHWMPSTIFSQEDLIPATTTFYAKANSSNVYFYQNESGYSIAQYKNDQTSVIPQPRHYFGLMESKGNWINPTDAQNNPNDYPYLAFEDNL